MKIRIQRGPNKDQLRRERDYLRQEIANTERGNREVFKEAWRQRTRRGTASRTSGDMAHYWRGWEQCLEFLQERITGEADPEEL